MRLNNTLLNNQQITEEIKKEIKICIEMNENENTTTQNLWDKVKAVLRGKFIAIQAYLKKQEKIQINNLTLHLKHREGNGTPLQYSCLGNPMGRGAWKAAVHGVAKSQTRLSNFTFTFMHWRRKWQPTPVFLPGESQGWGKPCGLLSMGSHRVGHD